MMMLSSSLPPQDDYEEQPQRGEDYDLLSGWARSLSVSPRLFPTYGIPSSSSSHHHHQPQQGDHHSLSFSSYRGLSADASPMLGPLRHDSLSMATGLSPLLGPTHPPSTVLGVGSGASGSGAGSMLMASGAYDYSTFGQYHTSPPLGTSHHALHASPPLSSKSHSHSHAGHSSGMARRSSRTGSAHSFSNVDGLRSMSPQELPPPLRSRSPVELKAENVEGPAPTAVHEPAPPVEEEDPRIRAYAKLEFPTFDIYIQKLSVVIGRRPAGTLASAVANAANGTKSQPPSAMATELASALNDVLVDAPITTDVKLEDFVVEMGEEDAKGKHVPPAIGDAAPIVKQEEIVVPLLSVTPSSQPPSPVPTAPRVQSLPEFTSAAGAASTSSLPATPATTEDAVVPNSAEQVPAIDVSEAASLPLSDLPALDSSTIPPPPTEQETSDLLDLLTLANATSLPLASHDVLPPPPANLTDIDLGPIRAVSRQHARLYFDYEMGGWAIEVLGRNGVVVEGKWTAKGEREPLGKRTKIQIAERIFYFVLPTIEAVPEATPAPSAPAVGERAGAAGSSDLDVNDEDSGDSDDEESSSLSEVSESDSGELSPHVAPIVPQQTLPTIRIKMPPRTSSSTSTGSLSTLALAPPVRAAAKGAVYARQGGKRLEVLQAARGAGKGKGKGKGVANKGKNKVKKGGSNRVRRPSDASARSDSVLDDEDEGGGEGEGEGEVEDEDGHEDSDEMEVDDVTLAQADFSKKGMASRNKTASKKDEHRRIVIKQHSVPKKQPKRDLQQLQGAPTLSIASPSPLAGQSPDFANPPLPPLPTPLSSTAPVTNEAGPNGPSPASAPSQLPGTLGAPTQTPVAGPSRAGVTVSGQQLVPGALPGQPGGPPVKRGRGRPPKNGICAQRPRKPKPDAAAQAAAARKAAGLEGIDPALPAAPIPTRAPAQAPYTPAPMPILSEGAQMPVAAPAHDLYTKPPYTYASLIAQAVSNSEHGKLTLNGIYDWITARWPYFSDNQNGWQNSIRHNLTLSRGFLKIPRRDDEVGKGAFWAIDPAQVCNFDGLHFRKKVIKPASPSGAKPLPPSKPPAPAKQNKPANNKGKNGQSSNAPSLSAPLPIVVSPIPDSYVRPAPPPASAPPPDDLTAALLKDPPIVLHEGRLILNPAIFENLTKEQLDNLQTLPASQALQILQAYVVQHFKEKMGKMSKEKARIAAAAKEAAALEAAKNGANGEASTSTVSSSTTESTSTPSASSTPAAIAPTASPGPQTVTTAPPSEPPVANVTAAATDSQPPPPRCDPVDSVPASSAAPVPRTASIDSDDDVVIMEPKGPATLKRKLESASNNEASAPKAAKHDDDIVI